MRLLGSEYARNAFAAGAPPLTPLEKLTALPGDPQLDLVAPLRGEEENGTGSARMGREGKKGEGEESRAEEGKGP